MSVSKVTWRAYRQLFQRAVFLEKMNFVDVRSLAGSSNETPSYRWRDVTHVHTMTVLPLPRASEELPIKGSIYYIQKSNK